MANGEQLAILRQGVEVWNKWRTDVYKMHTDTSIVEVNLSGADLSGADLKGYWLYFANLSGANLSRTNLSNANLSGVNCNGSNLARANLSGTFLLGANLTVANLSGANLSQADLRQANLSGADLSGADLSGADLSEAILVKTIVSQAKISGSAVYGVNVWDLNGEFEEQKDMIITPSGVPIVTVDNIKVAQFIYLILNNQEIRDVLDTVTTKAVLILGRFYDERKQVLEALKDALRERGFVPIIFDFEPSKKRDLTETIQLLANMAKFVIADITDAKSIPQELSHIIPSFPSVPVQPILLASEREYAIFEHWRGFKTVLAEFLYRDKQDLVDNIEAKILQPINA